jgi:NAD-dependent histone deacetylase SIR2
LLWVRISVASGIPDFRSSNGIFAKLRNDLKINGKTLFTSDFGIKKESRKIYLKYISGLKALCDGAEPNEMHSFLKEFKKSRIYT